MLILIFSVLACCSTLHLSAPTLISVASYQRAAAINASDHKCLMFPILKGLVMIPKYLEEAKQETTLKDRDC